MKNVNRLLATHPGTGAIRLCDCGAINLNVGTVTLHLAPAAFLKTTAMMQQAAREYIEQKSALDLETEFTDRLGSHPRHFTN